MKTSVFIYCRVSGQSQAGPDKVGIDRQRQACADFARKNKMQITCEFKDTVSGTKDAFNRPGLTDLLVALKANGVKTVLVSSADRFARDIVVQEILLREFKKMNCKVIAVDSGTDLSLIDHHSPATKLIRQVLGAVSEFEKDMIVMRLRVGKEILRRAKADKHLDGVLPYGQTDEEKEIIDTICAMRKSGATIKFIVDYLNNVREIKPPSGTRFHASLVNRILKRAKCEAPIRRLIPRHKPIICA